MPEVDPVILELIAKNDQYLAELRNTTKVAEQQLGRQEKRVKQLEAQMRASTSRIAGSLHGLAATFATYFTGRELVGLLDSFTRLQNELRVAGLEGKDLADVQERLFQIANDNGAAINSLADLYGKSASAARDFGASQEQMLTLTEASALSLRITGTNAQAASGALLGLSQALASGTVRAEEFNQMNEGGLRPLLQAAAASDQFGGSIGKLRNAVVEGEVSSREFFDAVLQGSAQLRDQAGDAVLTLSGAFTTLNNKLIEYIGGAASANGVTGAMATGIKLLADNLGTVIEALAVIGGVLLLRYTAGMVAAGAATATTSNIIFAMQARALGAATSMEALGFASRAAGASMLAAFGGPVGAAILAVAAGLYLVHQRTNDLDDATGRYAAGLEASNGVTDKARELAQKLATARGEERDATLEALRVEKARAQQALISAKNDIIAARAALARAAAMRQQQSERQGLARGIGGMGMDPGGISTSIAGIPERQAAANLAAAEQAAKNIEAGLESISAIIAGASGGVADPSTDKPTKPRKPTGPTAAEIAARHEDELSRLRQEELLAQIALTDGALDRSDLEKALLAEEYVQRSAQVANDQDFTAAQKAAQQDYLDRLYGRRQGADGEIIVTEPGLLQQAVNRDAARQREQEAQDLADERFRAEEESLRLQYDLAQTEADRRDLAHKMIEVEDEYLRAKLRAVLAADSTADAEERRLAQIALNSLENSSGARHRIADRAHQGALGDYLDSTADPEAMAEEAAARELQAVRDGLVDGLTDNLGIENQFVKDMLTIFLDQVLFRPIAEALQQASSQAGGIGGLMGTLLSALGLVAGGGVSKSAGTVGTGALKGFAAGGSMMIGGIGGTDNNVLSMNGQPFARVSRGERLDITPNLRANATRSGGPMNVTVGFNNDFRGAAPEAVAQINARLDRMQRELPGTIVTTMQDARSRFIWRDR